MSPSELLETHAESPGRNKRKRTENANNEAIFEPPIPLYLLKGSTNIDKLIDLMRFFKQK